MSRSTYLFASPTFWSGAASVLDLRGILPNYNFCLTPDQAEAWATMQDWAAVGDEFRASMAGWFDEQDPETLKLIEHELDLLLPPKLKRAAWQLHELTI